jgi:Skp family chaperone for outer membrane proteins
MAKNINTRRLQSKNRTAASGQTVLDPNDLKSMVRDGLVSMTMADREDFIQALEAEMKPRVTELQGLQARLQTISNDLKNMQANTTVPLDPKAAAAKQEEGQKLQREFEFKKKEYDAAMAKRGQEVLAPIQNDLLKAIGDFAKQKGYVAVLDIAALANDNMNAILALDPTANVTKEFITFYNARPGTTATTATPR